MQRPSSLAQCLTELAAMPAFLEAAARELTGPAARQPAPDGSFSLVEHVWHLADLEREGYGSRIERLRQEDQPVLPDFDGARMARERDYRSRTVADGLAAFTVARRANVAVLESAGPREWDRAGRQEGVGPVTLRDIPFMMAEHDARHRDEIEALLEDAASRR